MTKINLRTRLLQTGWQSIETNGWQNVSLRQLATQCDVSHASTYRHFKDKDDLMLALVPDIALHFSQFLQEGTPTGGSPAEILQHIAWRHIEYAQQHANFFDYLFLSPYALPTRLDEAGQLELTESISSFNYSRQQIQTFVDSLEQVYDFNTVFIHLWSFIFGMSLLVRQGVFNPELLELRPLISRIIAHYH